MKIAWDKVDWDEQDVVIARSLGCSREAVRQKRPDGVKALHHRKYTGVTVLSKLDAMKTDGMTLDQVAGLVECGVPYVGIALRRMGKAYTRRPRGNAKYDWMRFPIGWRRMTDKQIALVVGVSDPAVVAQWRNRHGYRKQVTAVKPRKVVASCS